MPSEFRKELTAFGPEQRVALGTFTTNSTNAPTIVDMQGVESITRSNVGEFTVTLAHAAKHYNVTFGVEFTTAAQTVYVESKSATNRTIVFQVVGAGGNTAAETTGLTVNFQVFLRWTN